MAWQGGWVQLEQCNIQLALNMAKMDNGGYLCSAIEKTQYRIKKPPAEIRAEKKWRVQFPWHKMVTAVKYSHPAMLCRNHTIRCFPSQNGTAKNLHLHWRYRGMNAPPPDRHSQPTPDLTPSVSKTPLAPPGDTEGAQSVQMNNFPLGYV